MSELIKRKESYFNESWPIGLLQACPRCGNETHNYLTPNESLWFDAFAAGCYKCNHSENREHWNLRPVEHKLEQQITQLTKERDQLAAKCAEMRDALSKHHEWSVYQSKHNEIVYSGALRSFTEHALSDQCGVGWLSPEKAKVLVEALESAVAAVWDGHYSGKGVEIAYAQSVDRQAKQALEEII